MRAARSLAAKSGIRRVLLAFRPQLRLQRNRFVGLVTRVVRDEVMAQVDIQSGPHRIVSLMSREAADELGLQPGVTAIAAIKSTNVVVQLPRR